MVDWDERINQYFSGIREESPFLFSLISYRTYKTSDGKMVFVGIVSMGSWSVSFEFSSALELLTFFEGVEALFTVLDKNCSYLKGD